MSSVDSTLKSPLRPIFPLPSNPQASPSSEKPAVQSLIATLNLQPHVEGGYFAETDRDPTLVPNPFRPAGASSGVKDGDEEDATRNSSTTIFYLVTEKTPMGAFHRNKARTVHTLHRGRGRYVIIHADEVEAGKRQKARVETFVVGQDVEKGERLQWIVDGGKYKCSFLLPDVDGGKQSGGLLISETVVPGFDFKDHDFCPADSLGQLVTAEQAKEMEWMVRKE